MGITRTLNSLLSCFNLQLVRRSMLYDWQVEDRGKKVLQRKVMLPEGAAEYLILENKRLQELRDRYSSYQSTAGIAIVWTDEYVQSYGLQSFRGDNCYVWQSNDPNCDEINYCLTSYYAQSVDSLKLWEKNEEDGLFGALTHTVQGKTISRDLLDSIIELSFLEKHLSISRLKDLKILDIGAGYGRLAHRSAFSLSNLDRYFCTDAVPESTFLSEYYTRFRHVDDKVQVVPLDAIEETLKGEQVNLAVNIHSFSECSLEAIDWWLALLASNRVKHLFVAPNHSGHGGTRLSLNSGEDFSELVEKYGYMLKVKAPKYEDPLVQKYGVSPTHYYLFQLNE